MANGKQGDRLNLCIFQQGLAADRVIDYITCQTHPRFIKISARIKLGSSQTTIKDQHSSHALHQSGDETQTQGDLVRILHDAGRSSNGHIENLLILTRPC
jgi:hypothetical protein